MKRPLSIGRRKVSKREFRRREAPLNDRLLGLQREHVAVAGPPVIVLLSGLPTAGKSEAVQQLLEWLDPKHVGVEAWPVEDPADGRLPAASRYWRSVPPRGRIAFFYEGWYAGLRLRFRKHGNGDAEELARVVARVRAQEATLVADGVRLVKVALGVGERELAERLDKLASNPLTRWRVTREERWVLGHFTSLARAQQRMLRATHTAAAPWYEVGGADHEACTLAIGELLAQTLAGTGVVSRPAPRARRSARAGAGSTTTATATGRRSTALPAIAPLTLLPTSPEGPSLTDDEYDHELATLQGRLAILTRRRAFSARGLVVVFEGMDAAGKGGAIRRVTHALDARQYRIVPVGKPTVEELRYPWLWRFWRDLPPRGHVGIFDRSWYGRVLVERVRKLTPVADWQRGYAEIIDFERELASDGWTVVKFWLAVGRDEQRLRLKAREADPLRRFKVDPEDWKNRRLWRDYEQAAWEMLQRTSTQLAPWHYVPADDKRHARLAVLRGLLSQLD